MAASIDLEDNENARQRQRRRQTETKRDAESARERLQASRESDSKEVPQMLQESAWHTCRPYIMIRLAPAAKG